MAQTLGAVRSADFILHIVDLSSMNRQLAPVGNIIDHEIYHYGAARQNYIILANKTDLPAANDNLPITVANFPGVQVLPISALHSDGFKEVKAYVARNL